MNILILGGAGFIGTNLVKKILSKGGHSLTVVDSLEPLFKSNLKNIRDVLPEISFIKGDIRDTLLMKRVIKNQDVIVNCAAQTSHPLSIKKPLLDAEINCIGNLTVLEAIKDFNPRVKYIFISSSTLIGKALGETVDEKHSEMPLDIYSANKGVAEKYCYIYHKIYGIKTVSLRFSNIYGPYGKNSPDFGFINYFINLAYRNKEIPIYGDGNQIRNVMFVDDVCELIYRCMSKDSIYGDTYFAVHREHYSILEIAQTIITTFDKGKIKKISWPDLRKKIEINNVIISGAKLFYSIQWEPKFNLKEGLTRTKEILEEGK